MRNCLVGLSPVNNFGGGGYGAAAPGVGGGYVGGLPGVPLHRQAASKRLHANMVRPTYQIS